VPGLVLVLVLVLALVLLSLPVQGTEQALPRQVLPRLGPLLPAPSS
jgi:hypothetical protein